MKYKGLLLDIDNTLYDYNITHAIAKKHTLEYCADAFNLKINDLENAYNIAREKVNIELLNTASSHNRLLYFQNMCALLKLNPLSNSLAIYNIYWDVFLENMEPFNGIYQLLEKYKNKICLVTDLTAHIQYRKIEKLKLNKYCNQIVTSEEAGQDKPSPYMFMKALQRLNLQEDNVCMIGDSFKKDICGAVSLNIDAIWFNHENKKEIYQDNRIKEVKTIEGILQLI